MNDEVRRLGDNLLLRIPALVKRLESVTRPLDPGGYGAVDMNQVRPLAEAVQSLVVRLALIEQRRPVPENLEWLHSAVEARARLGVPADSLVATVPAVFSEIWSECLVIARDAGLTHEALSEANSLLHAWGSTLARETVRIYQQIESETARAEERRRTQLLQSILTGSLMPSHTVELSAYGMARGRPYYSFRARGTPGAESEIDRALRSAAESGGGLVGVVGGDVAGVLAKVPELAGFDGVVGVGPAAELASIAPSFETATLVLRTASGFGLRGIFFLEDLGVLPAIASEARVADSLVARYLDPLEGLGTTGRVLEDSVRTYIECNLQIDAAARTLVVHRNTLRYRLKRFEDLTGADLGSIEEVERIYWALRKRALDRVESSEA